jgi:hypothetical protein
VVGWQSKEDNLKLKIWVEKAIAEALRENDVDLET